MVIVCGVDGASGLRQCGCVGCVVCCGYSEWMAWWGWNDGTEISGSCACMDVALVPIVTPSA